MFKKFFMNKMEKIQENELEDFVSRMRYLDSDSLGLPVVMTVLWADELKQEFGWDVYYPYVATVQDDTAILKIGSRVRELQKKGEEGNIQAVGCLVWTHTLRAAINNKLIGGVRELWSHLERGFPHAQNKADEHFLGELPHLGRFPEGFTPEVQ